MPNRKQKTPKQIVQQKRNRKHNRSSAGNHIAGNKRYKQKSKIGIASDSDSSEYFDLSESSEQIETGIPPHPSPLSTMPGGSKNEASGSSCYIIDYDKLCSKMGPILAPMIIRELKDKIVNEKKAELKTEAKDSVTTTTHNLQSDIQTLKSTNTQLLKDPNQTKRDLDKLEQYGRRMCLDISNIPGDTGDMNEDVQSKILDRAKKIKFPLERSGIGKCHMS